jgi:hypothetical protein
MGRGLLILLLLVLAGCKTTKYVPVETVRTDTCYITKHQRDSIMLRDSIYVKEVTKGDTVYVNVDKWHMQYIEKQLHDTLYIATHDTIPDPYPVETPLTWRQKMSIKFFPLCSVLASALLVWTLRKPLLRLIRTWLGR